MVVVVAAAAVVFVGVVVVVVVVGVVVLFTAIELSLGGCSLSTSTNKTNMNKYT